MSIEFRNVYFRYSESSPWILENCSFTVEKGEHVCLAGRSGAGKTTVLKLILGILTPTSGEILVDGKSLADYGMHTLRKSTGVVLQNDKLYSGSIVDNVSYFDEAVSVDRVTECLEHASVLSDVRKLTMGLYSLCDEDSTSLSSGQVQRLIIARALYANPVLLLMDEATSHLDVGTEQEVTAALKALDCTRIFIAHRPEAIATAHRVMKMQQGRLVEDNTYKLASDFAPLF